MFLTAEKNDKTGADTAKPCITSSGVDIRKKEENDVDWTPVTTKKPRHRIVKLDSLPCNYHLHVV